MKWLPLVALALVAASCGAPAPPEEWTVNRQVPGVTTVTQPPNDLCDEIRSLALGAHAADPDLAPTLAEMARISATVGATAALPALNRVTTALADGAQAGEIHDDLVAAATAIDPASYSFCEVPMFTATYAATGWPACHGELVIPVAGYTLLEPDRGCSATGIPSFLPCWADEAPHLPVDCSSGEIVQVVDGDWVTAGEPREVTAPEVEVEPEELPVPSVIPVNSPECASLGRLFTGPDPIDTDPGDFDRLRGAAADLGPGVSLLVEELIAANTNTPDPDAFAALVLTLDETTATTCGLPIVSAWAALAGGVPELPCWIESGEAIPPYVPVACLE